MRIPSVELPQKQIGIEEYVLYTIDYPSVPFKITFYSISPVEAHAPTQTHRLFLDTSSQLVSGG